MPDTVLHRPNRFVIDLQVVAHNTATLRARAPANITFFATIKADAYGFGLIPVARTVLEAGADALSVVRLEDAVALRQAGLQCPILLYAGHVLGPDQVAAIEQYDLWPAIHHHHALDALARHLTRPVACALKIECGQERLGVPAEQAAAFAAALIATGKLHLRVVHTHPHVTDDPNHLQWQYNRFSSAFNAIASLLPEAPPIAVFAGTRALALRPDMMCTGIDPGQALFRLPDAFWQGPGPSPTPFQALTSTLIHTYDVQRTDYLPQSLVPTAPGSRIGIIPLGYGDGFSRLHAGDVLIHGKRARILTPLSVEYTRLDLTHCPQAQIGDEVVIVGTQQGNTITPDDVMHHTGVARVTDLVIPLGAAIPRAYVSGPATAAIPTTSSEKRPSAPTP